MERCSAGPRWRGRRAGIMKRPFLMILGLMSIAACASTPAKKRDRMKRVLIFMAMV